MTASGRSEPSACPADTAPSPPESFLEHAVRQTFPAAQPWLGFLLLVATVVLTYRGVSNAGFIWDDDIQLTHNPCIVGPLGFVDIWTTRFARICPLVISSFWLQYQCWGLNALPYHLVNVAFHTTTALVLWRTLLVLRVPGAWLGAMLWAVHPVQVESVAWISELKNTQSGLFFVLCLYCHAKWERGAGTSRRLYALAILCGAAAMASKSSTVVLPPLLLLSSWWITGRFPRRRWLAVLPYILMAAATVAWSMVSQHLEGANGPVFARSLPERVITAARVIWFYLGKLAWPAPLMFIYPRWTVNAASIAAWLPVLALVATTMVVARLAWKGLPWARAAGFAGGFFVIALLPVVGLVDHYFLRYSFVGDHFQYLASMGPLALAASSLVALANRLGRHLWDAASVGCAALVLAFAYLSHAHVPVFDSDAQLWRDSLQRNPQCWLAANNLGVTYLQAGDPGLAQRHFERMLDVFPDSSSIRNNLGLALFTQGRKEEAVGWYRKALALNPDDGETHLNLANALLTSGVYGEAVEEFQKSLNTLPGAASTHQSMATALAGVGRLDEALGHYRKALALDPNSPVLRYNLGNALAQAGRMSEAVQSFEQALRQASDFSAARHNLAWVLATTADDSVRNGSRALELAQYLQRLPGGDSPMIMRLLAAAQFETGRKDEAVKTAQNAILLALTAKDSSGLADALRSDLDGYRRGKPLRIVPGQAPPSGVAPPK